VLHPFYLLAVLGPGELYDRRGCRLQLLEAGEWLQFTYPQRVGPGTGGELGRARRNRRRDLLGFGRRGGLLGRGWHLLPAANVTRPGEAGLVVLIHCQGALSGRCDAKCYNAEGGACHCICGGRNHGKGLDAAKVETANLARDAVAEIESRGGWIADEIRQGMLL